MGCVTRLQVLRGTTVQRLAMTPFIGELVFDTSLMQMFVGDGVTAGGIPFIAGAGSSEIIDFHIAGQTISALKLVCLDASGKLVYADNTSSSLYKPIGLSLTAGVLNDSITILKFGELQDASFAFPLYSKLFLGTNGNIVTTAPSVGWLTPIGYQVKSNAIDLNISTSIYRGV